MKMAKKTSPTKQPQDQHQAAKSRQPPVQSVPWGRAAMEYRPGLFIKRYLEEHGEACAAEIYYELSREIERINEERAKNEEKPLRRPNYSSFARYFHWFKILKLVRRTDRREAAAYGFLQQRVFFALTPQGQVEVQAWADPVGAAHPEFR